MRWLSSRTKFSPRGTVGVSPCSAASNFLMWLSSRTKFSARGTVGVSPCSATSNHKLSLYQVLGEGNCWSLALLCLNLSLSLSLSLPLSLYLSLSIYLSLFSPALSLLTLAIPTCPFLFSLPRPSPPRRLCTYRRHAGEKVVSVLERAGGELTAVEKASIDEVYVDVTRAAHALLSSLEDGDNRQDHHHHHHHHHQQQQQQQQQQQEQQ